MAEEFKKSPAFDIKMLPADGTKTNMTLTCAKSKTSGTNKFDNGDNNWYLWVGMVENVPAVEGRGAAKKIIPAYSGEVVMFASDELNEQLLKITGGVEENVQILLSL